MKVHVVNSTDYVHEVRLQQIDANNDEAIVEGGDQTTFYTLTTRDTEKFERSSNTDHKIRITVCPKGHKNLQYT